MSGYKVVPVEPTTAMREVWKRMRGYCWYDKYKAMLAAVPAVQGEPDVSALVEALESALGSFDDWCEGQDPSDIADAIDVFPWVLQARAALAAYRKQEPSHDNQ